MGLIAKPRTARTFPPQSLTLEQILADLDSAHLFDPLNPFSFSPCTQPTPAPATATPIATPDPAFSYTTWLQSQSQMMPAPGGGAPPPPLPPNKSTSPSGPCPSNPQSSAKSQASSTPTSSSSPTKRPRKKPRKDSSVRFACPKCPSTFSRKDNLATHARVHTGERPYTCRFCARTFMWPSSARTHELTHLRNQKKHQNRGPVPQPRVLPYPQHPAQASQQSQAQLPSQSLYQSQIHPHTDSSVEQRLVQDQRSVQVGNVPRMSPAQGRSSLQEPPSHYASVGAVNPLGLGFETGPVRRESKTEVILAPVQQSSEAQGQQHSSSQIVPPRWSGPIDPVVSSTARPAQTLASGSTSQRLQMPFAHQPALPQHGTGTSVTSPSDPVVSPVENVRQTSLGLAPMQASGAETVDPVHAGVLATIEGLIGNTGPSNEDSVGDQTHVGVGEGVNPIFGENVGSLSQNELERHMDAIFQSNPRQGSNEGSGDGDDSHV